MIWAWLTTKTLFGLARGAWVGIAAAALIAAALWLNAREAADDRQNREIGAQSAVIAGQRQTLDQLGDANDAEANLRAGGERSADRYNECLRNSRNKPACERYNPNAAE